MIDLISNPILLTDGYKPHHWKQYPPGMEAMYSYMAARGGYAREVQFFGLQYILLQYLEGQRVTPEKIREGRDILDALSGPGSCNVEGWWHIVDQHQGRIPLRIGAVAEGSTVPVGQPMLTVENTCEKCAWVVNYFESLLEHVWHGTSVATNSRACYTLIEDYLERTGSMPETAPNDARYKLHDFGFRGVSSVESAAVGGAAHLINFRGSDTVIALKMIRDAYDTPVEYLGRVAKTIPASEHSTITAWGKDHEVDAFRNMLDQYPTGLVACVSDSYDIGKAISQYWGEDLRERVLLREGQVVIRPDSPWLPGWNVPHTVYACVSAVGQAFGYVLNDKGYKVLNPHVRIIQGDGVDREIIEATLAELKHGGWSADNVSFGMGGALLQKLNRDTHKFAIKASWAQVNGVGRDVYKEPRGDASKASHHGRWPDELPMRFLNGRVFRQVNFQDVREAAIGY